MIVKIKCPECGTDGSLSLAQSSYRGPYKCWKCRKLFTIEMVNDKLDSLEPLSQEEFDKQQALEALRTKFQRQ